MTAPRKTNSPPRKRRPAENEIAMNVSIARTLHKKVRIKCLDEGIQLKEAVAAALTEWIKK